MIAPRNTFGDGDTSWSLNVVMVNLPRWRGGGRVGSDLEYKRLTD